MQSVYFKGEQQPERPNMRQQYHSDLIQALHRRQNIGFQTALKQPGIIAAIERLQKDNQGRNPEFRK